MTCAGCGRVNRADSRFCVGCGKPLAPRCPACGVESEPEAQFCGACGASLDPQSARPADTVEARKVVTIVFADLIGSTALHERLDPESVSRVMERYHGAVRAPVEAHGGTVVQLLGDGVMCAFGVPHVAEDDAIRAVRAAVGIQQAFREFVADHAELLGDTGLRVAVNTGEVVVSDDYAAGIGDPLNVAARLQQEARDGDVLIGESTERLVRDRVTLEPFGVFQLKGRAERVAAYRVVSLERPAGVAATPFVGRDDELRRIGAVYDAAVAAPATRLVVILGSPGLGKSRLLDELGRRLDGTTVLRAQCEAAGGATFAPLARALRTLLHVDDAIGGEDLRAVVAAAVPGEDSDRARIGDGIAALLAATPALPEETFFVVRRFLAALAATPASPEASQALRPVVLAIDDLQWAEPLLLDLIEHLVQWGDGVPLLVLAAARPDLRDRRSSLATPGGLVSDVVTLAGLDAGAATRLAADVVGAAALPAAVAGRVLATSEGNPLFVSELVRMLVNDGALKREGDRWTATVDLAALEMPPTIHALLAARIERLRAEDRLVLERAAIVGRQFSRAAVAHLLPREVTDLDARLEALKRSELIEPDAGWFLGEPALRFHHGLTRDAAYRRVLKGTRAELHGRCAEWIESRVGETVEHDEMIGWHLEQAHQHLRELGPIDESGRALGERAARYLAAAGRRALARDDVTVAASLLGRAIDRLDPTDPARPDLALDWCEALLTTGDVGPAASAIAELGRFASAGDGDRGSGVAADPLQRAASIASSSDPDPRLPTPDPRREAGRSRLRAWHTCFAGQLAVLTDPQALHGTAAVVAAAADALAAAGDDAGEAKAHLVHALALSRLGRIGACEAELDKALAAARRAHDRRRANTVLANAPLAALWGPSPVTRASGRCLDVVRVLRITQEAPAVEAVALRCQAVLEALRGRAEAARRMIASSRRMVEELGITQGLLETEFFAGLIALFEGDTGAAEHSLRAAYEGLRSHGLGIDAARAAALLGRTLLAQGRAAEAEALSHESEALAGDDLQAAITWRRVRAEALARRGEHAAAVDLARAAVDIAAATDALIHHADARLGLAVALRAAGRHEEAAAEETRAIELWEAKGATVLADRTRSGAERIVEVDQVSGDRAAPARPAHRRVDANDATAGAARFVAAMAAGNVDEISALVADDLTVVHHPTGVEYDREGLLVSVRSHLRAREPTYRLEPLATLGTSLALFRQTVSSLPRDEIDIGAAERVGITLMEVDAQERNRHTEYFASDRLGDAVARLYERYAELLPVGAERERAAATARSFAALAERLDLDRWAAAIAPDVVYADHRTLGLGQSRGAAAFLRGLGSLLELADDVANRTDDVLAVRSDAHLLSQTNLGTERAGGGAYERAFLVIRVFGADGLLTRLEQFDLGQESEALARFDELVARSPASRPARRRVRPNAATAHAARLSAAIAARDSAALPTLMADEGEAVHHPTHTVYDVKESLRVWRAMIAAGDGRPALEPLSTLGESLALCHHCISASGARGENFDVGAYEVDLIALVEVDEQGRRRRVEFFAPDRLGDAVARLYERYAELLPDGAERERAAATARSVAVLVGSSFEVDRWATAIAPGVEAVDHRTIGLGSARGAEVLLRVFRSLREVADDVVDRVDDILALRPDALLARWTNFGTDRAGGGAYERPFLAVGVIGADGLLTRLEQFDLGDETEALTRFDELVLSPVEGLTAGPPALRPPRRRVRPNAATANAARTDAAVAARDLDALQTLLSEQTETVDHTMHVVYGRAGVITTWRGWLRAQDLSYRHEPVATLGNSLALCRVSVSGAGVAGGSFDVGAYEGENVHLIEVDAAGRRQRLEIFTPDRLGDAVVRLYERYAEFLPDGLERDRAAATARTIAALPLSGPHDLDRLDRFDSAHFAPAFEYVDHRTVGMGTLHGAEALRTALRALLELVEDSTVRTEDVLALRPDGLLVRWTHSGTDRTSGGAFERRVCLLWVFGDDGRQTRGEQFDAEREDVALARFDELTEPAAAARIENAATRAADRARNAWEARDLERIAATIAPGFRQIDRRKLTHLDYGRNEYLEWLRAMSRMRSARFRAEVLATRGARLALTRVLWSGASGAVGPSEVEFIQVDEVDADGRFVANVTFDPDDFDAAYAELDERYASGEAASFGAVTAGARAFAAAVTARDWNGLASVLAPDLVVYDHRPLGWETLRGPAMLVDTFRSLVALAPDVRLRIGHVTISADGSLAVATFSGTHEGGEFEDVRVVVHEYDGCGKIRRHDIYSVDRLDEAWARFADLHPDPLRIPPNAATRAFERRVQAATAGDWEAHEALCAPALVWDDRRRAIRTTGDRDLLIANDRYVFSRGAKLAHRVLATAGDRLALQHNCWTAADGRAPFEIETLNLIEVDAEGRIVAIISFDPTDRRAASAELLERYARSGADEMPPVWFEFWRAWNDHDLDRLRTMLLADYFFHDHRRTGIGRVEGEAYIAALAPLYELSPDVRLEPLYCVAEAAHGCVDVLRWVGTNAEGGEFESVFVRLILFRGDRLAGLEQFELEDLDQARARFDELRPGR